MPEPDTEPYKASRRKSKKEMTDDEYIKVCERMAQLRETRKANKDKPKAERQVKEKVIIKYVDRPIEAKPRANQLDSHESLKKELTQLLSILNEMK
jgi:hypothetical protein